MNVQQRRKMLQVLKHIFRKRRRRRIIGLVESVRRSWRRALQAPSSDAGSSFHRSDLCTVYCTLCKNLVR